MKLPGRERKGIGLSLNEGQELTGARRWRARHRDEVRAAILDAAPELVNRHGASGLTMRAVAEAVGYSPGALYEYFRSKGELLETLYFQGSEGLNARTAQVLADAGPETSLLNRMRLAAHAYRDYALEHPDLYRLIFSIVHTTGSELSDFEDSSFGALLGLLRGAAERGGVQVDDPLHTATGLWAFVHGFVMLELTGRLPSQPEGIANELFDAGLKVIAFGLLPRDDHRSATGGTSV